MTITMWSFALFLLIFLLIGFSSVLVRRKNNTDYLLAGRSLPPSLVGLSAVATNNSGYMFIGVIGFTYSTGLSAIWLMVGWILGDLLISQFVHRRLRVNAENHSSLTFPEILSSWYGQNQVVLRRVAALIAVVFLGTYAAAQFNAGGKALHVLFDWDLRTGAVIGAVMVLFYCFSGGMRASVWTDAAQSGVMIPAMVVMVTVVVANQGGIAETWTKLNNVSATHMNWFPRDLAFGFMGPVLFVLGWLFAGIGVIGQPHIMIRFMALDDAQHLQRARLYYYLWFTTFYFLANAVGLISRLIIPEANFDAEMALPTLAEDLLPPVVAGLVLAGLFAATISTADSLILSCSAAIARDLPPEHWHNYVLTRASTLIVIVLALTIALSGNKNVFELVIDSWAVLGAASAPLLVVLVLGGRPPQWLAVAMVVTGPAVIYLWPLVPGSGTIYPLMPGMLAGWLVYGVGVLILRNQEGARSKAQGARE